MEKQAFVNEMTCHFNLMWKFYNLLTGANKSSYIDSFLDRSLNASEIALGINSALHGAEQYKWFIE